MGETWGFSAHSFLIDTPSYCPVLGRFLKTWSAGSFAYFLGVAHFLMALKSM
jgi:hypothetical protein